MISQEQLFDSTETFLKSTISDVLERTNIEFDSLSPFGELGVNSFHILKIIKKLESEFGTLPKTLLFENFNIHDLSNYLVSKYSHDLIRKFSSKLEYYGENSKPINSDISQVDVERIERVPRTHSVNHNKPGTKRSPVIILEKKAYINPEFADLISNLHTRYKNEAGVSRGTKLIAPYIFVGSERTGYFNYGRRGNMVLVYGFTGPKEHFPVLAKEIYDDCLRKNLELNFLTDQPIGSIAGISFSATPFGVMQRITNIEGFALDGGPMRRLRYQVSKFQKSGKCRTEEYLCGSNEAVDRDISHIIDQWCATRTVVNPLVYIVKEEILAGCFSSEHRLFLTYLDDVLQNVILISPMSCDLNGYLMDLEFYRQDMPLGGLEFAIVKIIETLAAEGYAMLSLGGTYGCKLESSPIADPDVDRILDELRKQNIFNDEGNLQFKNKFRPENKTIFLCRPVGSENPDNVTDIIMMIADPCSVDSQDEADSEFSPAVRGGSETGLVHTEPLHNNIETRATQADDMAVALPGSGGSIKKRAAVLSTSGYNVLNIPDSHIKFDLKTDSWAQLQTPAIVERVAHLRAYLQNSPELYGVLGEIFPFDYFVITDSGRTAEHVFFKAAERKGVVLQNLLFPTTVFHQIDKDFLPVEIPHPDVFKLTLNELNKGQLDIQELERRLASNAGSIAYVLVELCNNAAGGCALSVSHIKSVKNMLSAHSIPLVVDGARIIENLFLLIRQEQECRSGESVWVLLREILSCADILIASLTKDFCVRRGGVIATRDRKFFNRLKDIADSEGVGIDLIDRKVTALSLKDRSYIEAGVLQRISCVELIWKRLIENNVPVVWPCGGHCILVDVKSIPVFKKFRYSAASFAAWLYLNTGIRCAAHNVGMQEGTSINGLVRFAIPIGLSVNEAKEIATRFVDAFRSITNVPELSIKGTVPGSFGEVFHEYELVRCHNSSVDVGTVFTDPDATSEMNGGVVEPSVHGSVLYRQNSFSCEEISSDPETKNQGKSDQLPRYTRIPRRVDIAVVGMAGRYPKAENLAQMWENLVQAVDCVVEVPESRLLLRNGHDGKRYRGGFIDGIDRFDSMFFNISPREAETMDPQERLFLEVAWEAIEDAGYCPEFLVAENEPRNVGVFVGAVWAMYQTLGAEERLFGNNVTANSFLWTIANRVSYFMNFTGPSLAIDTACSSSLTAIYLACEAIYNNECSSALVGGVNLDIHQCKYDTTLAGGALSKDGVCRSFGRNANGYVAGEGVGAILIKSLDLALESGDNIYGIIKSAVVNHGGRTSGYSVPAPKAQADLILSALSKAEIDARTIGYVEAHGTGTELGDPVEIAGLTRVFQAHNVAVGSCPVGSIKTNIGHLEAAAGIVSVCKVLLQMRNSLLVPSLHSSELNEFIDFGNSPFYVERNLEKWDPKVVDGILYPLRAGVSSFGAGGSNAHIILEQYSGETEPVADKKNEALSEQVIPLSARNESQLYDAAANLLSHIKRNVARKGTTLHQDIEDIAYTLQAGRKSFEHRLAILAGTEEALIERLNAFLKGQTDDKILIGRLKNTDAINKLLSRKEKEEFVKILLKDRDALKLARLWIDGLLLDWGGALVFCRKGRVPKRVSLPTYPFADKRHWLASRAGVVGPYLHSAPRLHPLIDVNESTFERQIFKKVFTDSEFFIFDHRVSQIPTLPGVAYLEMARKAGEIAAGRRVRKISNIVWVSPITVENSRPQEVLIELKPKGETVQFEVFSESGGGDRRLYSQGRLSYIAEQGSHPEPEFVDINSIKSRCAKVLEGKDAYPLFKSLGLDLGPSFQVLEEIYKNESEVLGVLRIPEIRSGDFGEFVLHPSIVDGSFQAGMGAALADSIREMFIPYSIGEVEIIHPLERLFYSYVTSSGAAKNNNVSLAKSNVLILGEDGKVLVRIKDSVGVPLVNVHEKSSEGRISGGSSNLYYSYEWEKSPLERLDDDRKNHTTLLFDRDESLFDFAKNQFKKPEFNAERMILVIPGESFEKRSDSVYQINPHDRNDYILLLNSLNDLNVIYDSIWYAWSAPYDESDEGLIEYTIEHSFFPFLYLCQSLVSKKADEPVELTYFYTVCGSMLRPHDDAVNGFVRTLEMEHPALRCKVMEIRQDTRDEAVIFDALVDETLPHARKDTTVRYQGGERYIRKLKEFRLDDSSDGEHNAALAQGGVYLITGGLGGLGFLFAGYLARVFKARLVLAGRSGMSPDLDGRLGELRKHGSDVLYVQCDVSRCEDVRSLLEQARSHFGKIDGIIHSAGVLRDSYVKNKTRQEAEAVFASKIYGTYYLDKLTRHEQLDFFVMFSSVAAISGNAGQCDYSYANHFMDSFAVRRDYLRDKGERSGKTLSINWSIWADGGMRLDEQTELFFRSSLGINPLNADTGIQSFVRGLSSEKTQFAAVEGVREKIERAWGTRDRQEHTTSVKLKDNSSHHADDVLLPEVCTELTGIAMRSLKLDADEVDQNRILLDLGFDSIGLTTYANAINEIYGLDITPVLFFEHPSINKIAEYLLVEHKEKIAGYYGETRVSDNVLKHEGADGVRSETHVGAGSASLQINKGWKTGISENVSDSALPVKEYLSGNRFLNNPVAVVGIAGVMPQSEDLEEFWDNLKNARNMISVIPGDRWRWEDFYGDPLKQSNVSNSKWGGFMKEVDRFDPLFFGISPKEAGLMDPQQRIFLETVWKAIEDSGHKVSDLSGSRTGLFVGSATNDYSDLLTRQNIDIDAYTSTGNSHSVLANRISFLLNLRGPSAPIDTACSSSLVALHRAIESIHTGSSDMAIVGGVQVITSPSAYIAFGQAGMLSEDGKCKTFDRRANGYVRGEGSGAIFLKPLFTAEADGDHIYAVIKATAENHGGRVTTLTAPNPNAQAELLIETYEKAQIDPGTVGYIECHGTGTSLGDPVEIQALKKTFHELYKRHNKPMARTPHCGLGSVKTNIGHLETAAGIAGIIKILLAIKNRQIPATLHFKEINPYIDLKDSPFYIVDKTIDWEAVRNEKGVVFPRRAGISSFGFGGANAHIVFEEYVHKSVRSPSQSGEPQVIVVSARDGNRLEVYVRSLLTHLGKHAVDITDMAYTLQVGRDEMPVRLAVVVSSLDELKVKLNRFLERKSGIENLYSGDTGNRKIKSAFAEQAATEDAVAGYMERRELPRLAQLWVAGTKINWNLLYPDGTPQRVSLPTYPFARERYWIPHPLKKETRLIAEAGISPNADGYLHPLIHNNVSTLREQKFSSTFTGREFFLADHIVEDQMILPGVAYMEMARVAGGLSAQIPVQGIRNLVWVRPFILGEKPKHLDILLTANGQEVGFEVTSENDAATVVHCTGKLVFSSTLSDPDVLDIAGIKERCDEEIISGPDLYVFLARSGLALGNSFQIVEKICANKSESLAVLRLPDHLKSDASRFWLHPSMMDGSLHTAIGLMKKNGMDIPLSLPFSVGEVQILHPLTDIHYGYATWLLDDLEKGQNAIIKVNFQLLDEKGRVLVRMKDFISQPYRRPPVTMPYPEGKAARHPIDMMFYRTVWKKSALPVQELSALKPPGSLLVFDLADISDGFLNKQPQSSLIRSLDVILVKPGSSYEEVDHDVYIIDSENLQDYRRVFHSLLGRNLLPQNIVYLWPGIDYCEDSIELSGSLKDGVRSLLYLSQAVTGAVKEHENGRSPDMQTQPARNKIKLLYCYPAREERPQPHHAAASAFLKSINREDSRFVGKVIELHGSGTLNGFDRDVLLNTLLAELYNWDTACEDVRYLDNNRFVKSLEEFDMPAQGRMPVKENGVYLITGGLGGLGWIFARHLAETANARLILTGRSSPGHEQKERIRQLTSISSSVEYCRMNVSRFDDVKALIDRIRSEYKRIDGVIHAAGIIRDNSLSGKTYVEMEEVFAAKVDGTINLDRALKDDNLDFFALFSSISAVTGNAGQIDYAYANSFMDCFACYRNALQAAGKRYGRTLSINWPLWKTGGMKISDELMHFMAQTMGMHELDTESGLRSFSMALECGFDQVIVIRGEKKKVERSLGIKNHIDSVHGVIGSNDEEQANEAPEPVSGGRGRPNGQSPDQNRYVSFKEDLLHTVTQVIGIDKSKFRLDVDMSEYGFDSISLTRLFSEINDRYSLDLTPAVFFEYPTFNALSRFMFSEYGPMLSRQFGDDDHRDLTHDVLAGRPHAVIGKKPERLDTLSVGNRFLSPVHETPRETGFKGGTQLSIAIVGMSGVMPQSENLELFWDNLVAEKDLVSEIPPDRWDWRVFDGDPADGNGKTDSKWGGFMKEVDKFDTFFFGISPFEAELMDPQQRIFLETVWKTIEDAGHRPSELAGTKTGLFVGVGGSDYLEVMRDNGVNVVAYMSTGNTHSILANRISYFLDLHGPSEPVETACSSSLVAISRAVESICTGSSEMAIAGGVNVILSPTLYLAFGNAGMLAADGRCKTFDRRANGYVRGEGAGAIFLKRLDQAVKDGNHVYGVIRGIGVNHGGHATALTAPNPNAQADLLVDIYSKYQIDPGTISYIEAHGTGTPLGDPVEINALIKAFKEVNKQRGQSGVQRAYCGVGSVKTNIGHLETAAGIAGVIKVLLSMKYKKIPANIHFTEINPHIRMEGSPFYIVGKTQDWNPLKTESGEAIPRKAAVSSFSFGGANAHIVIEEYVPPLNLIPISGLDPENRAFVVPLSAKNTDRLKQKAVDLLTFVRKHMESPTILTKTDLADITYTLQVGREPMEERLGIVVSSIEQLIEKLESYINNQGDLSGFYCGNTNSNSNGIEIVSQDEDVKEAIINKLFSSKKLEKLLNLWVKGIDIVWDRLYGEIKPRRISLPTYPFSRERYWISPNADEKTRADGGLSILHPLLHRNTSSLEGLHFSSAFSGDECFLEEETAGSGILLLPAEAYLEMARVAVDISLPLLTTEKSLELNNVTWYQPFRIAGKDEINISLFKDDNDCIEYEIYSVNGGMESIHCQGEVTVSADRKSSSVDIRQLIKDETQDTLNGETINSINSNTCSLYRVKSVYFGDRQIVSQLVGRGDISDSEKEFFLPPSLLSVILKTVLFAIDKKGDGRTVEYRLNKLKAIEIFSRCASEMFACVQYSMVDMYENFSISLDVDFIDVNGNVCVSIESLEFEECTSDVTAQDIPKKTVLPRDPDIEIDMHHANFMAEDKDRIKVFEKILDEIY